MRGEVDDDDDPAGLSLRADSQLGEVGDVTVTCASATESLGAGAGLWRHHSIAAMATRVERIASPQVTMMLTLAA